MSLINFEANDNVVWSYSFLTAPALQLHFLNTPPSDVIRAAKKVIELQGQANASFDVLYELGYAYMRTDDFDQAVVHFKSAHRIDSKNVALRLVMGELRRKALSGQWRKRRNM